MNNSPRAIKKQDGRRRDRSIIATTTVSDIELWIFLRSMMRSVDCEETSFLSYHLNYALLFWLLLMKAWLTTRHLICGAWCGSSYGSPLVVRFLGAMLCFFSWFTTRHSICGRYAVLLPMAHHSSLDLWTPGRIWRTCHASRCVDSAHYSSFDFLRILGLKNTIPYFLFYWDLYLH